MTAGAAFAAACLHFAPPDHYVGDVHPIYVGEQCYLFYLRSEQPLLYRSALAVSDDLLNWRPLALTHLRPEMKHNEYFVVAPFFDHGSGLYRSYFGLESSRSADLLQWDRAEDYRLPRIAEAYDEQRDPCVTWDEDRHLWLCVMTCGTAGADPSARGAVGLFESRDLRVWEHIGPAVAGLPGLPECPQLFRIGRRWALVAAVGHGMVGGFNYWLADAPSGPWGERRRLDGAHFCAPQVVWDGRRWMAFAWAPLNAAPAPARPCASA